MPSIEDRLAALERWQKSSDPTLRRALRIANALEGRPSDAMLALPHNDSWLFEDNVDATHAANLRYVIAANVRQVVSARLSIHLAPYRTYSNFSVTSTGADSNGHNHTSAAHTHNTFTPGGSQSNPQDTAYVDYGSNNIAIRVSGGVTPTYVSQSTTPGGTGGESATHTHTVSGSSFLGVSEGASPSGITIAFDGVDQTVALGGPFNADVLELDVRKFLVLTPSLWHVIAMQPTGLGRIEAHLRLGVYVAAGQAQ